MKNVRVGIIGGTNGMGRWLADLLKSLKCTVCVTGRKTAMTASDAARSCDVVVVSVPITATAGVIAEIGPLMNKKQLLMDLTSLKKEPVALMLTSSEAEVVGCHPLFGPLIVDASGHNVVLCRGRGEIWYDWLKNIFVKSGYTLLESTPEQHDRMVAIVQALNHFNTIALGMVIAETGMPMAEITKYSTPIFRNKMELVKKVLMETPDLFADIISGNPHTQELVSIYERVVRNMRISLEDGNGRQLKNLMELAAKKLF